MNKGLVYLLVILFWILPIICGLIIAKKNRRPAGWMWLGLLGPIGAMIALVIISNKMYTKFELKLGEKINNRVKILIIFSAFVLICLLGSIVILVNKLTERYIPEFRSQWVRQESIKLAINDHKVIDTIGAPIIADSDINSSHIGKEKIISKILLHGPKGTVLLCIDYNIGFNYIVINKVEIDPMNGGARIQIQHPKILGEVCADRP